MSIAAARQRVENTYPTLPGRFQRSDVERVLTSICPRLGLSSGQLRALLIMMQATRPSDWTSPGVDAICYLRQMQVAERLGITPRAVRKHEISLERKRLIDRNLAADGSRGRFADGELIQGISFAPLIERFPEFLDLLEDQEAELRTCLVLRRKLSAAKRQLTRAVSSLVEAAPEHPAIVDLLIVLQGAPRRYEGLSSAALQAAFELVDNAARDALYHLNFDDDSTGDAEPEFRPHIQDTTDENLESCSGSEHCLEYKDRRFERGFKPGYLETFTPKQLYSMAGEDFRMYLDGNRRDHHPLTEHDFIQAASDLLRDLGIHPTAWAEAVDVMGELAAALCVLVIDANRNRPEKPVRQPGAMLRAMTRLADTGRLNLHGSLIGLKQRMWLQDE
ncbi:replication initiation protein RepC [Pseudogemmobacter humi]|uniref:Uncharacterized protein n=1 Tax=Pseudogemmobacter humi TaxID=2483812 RepID=A0A3P5XGU8_9RHOB|nr:replication initiation protein RepC [Pseudogemmobacter humi]VDC34023.1 hypothetical protein XINFAN_04221 [Pseudogemmobacter humi]